MEDTSLYHKYCQYSYEGLQELFKVAKSKEEQEFYMVLANLLLKEKQKKVMKQVKHDLI